MIGNKYKLTNRIGNGSFGEIFKGINVRTGEEVAIKVESINSPYKILKKEAQIYQYLEMSEGFPHLKWFGTDGINNYMVINLLGESIYSYIEKNGKINVKEAISYGNQMIDRISFFHSKKMIHRDIKPHNFLFGLHTDMIYLIDFGLSKPYMDNNDKHIPYLDGQKIIGSLNFISENVKNGIVPSRRDDVVSIIEVIKYMICEDESISKLNVILCEILNMGFSESPKYEEIKEIFKKLCKKW